MININSNYKKITTTIIGTRLLKSYPHIFVYCLSYYLHGSIRINLFLHLHYNNAQLQTKVGRFKFATQQRGKFFCESLSV